MRNRYVKILSCFLSLSLLLNIIFVNKYATRNIKNCEDSLDVVNEEMGFRNITSISNNTILPEINNTIVLENTTFSGNFTLLNETLTNNNHTFIINETTQSPPIKKHKIRIGNFVNSTILEQRRDRKVSISSQSIIQHVPTFSSVKIEEGLTTYMSLNSRLISVSKKYDLIIVIPSLARINSVTGKHADYLITVLNEYKKQLKRIEGKSILFIIHAFINEKTHKVFEKARRKFKDVAEFVFFVPPFRFADPFENLPDIDYSSPSNGYPGKMARQQTCDSLMMSQFIIDNFQFSYLLYTEDDFLPCNNMLNTTFQIISRIEAYHEKKSFSFEKGFCALRLSIGLGGFLVTKHYVSQLIEYGKNQIDFEPIDILVNFIAYQSGSGYRTCLEDGLTYYSSTDSLLEHIGHESNWKERNNKKVFGGRDVKCGQKYGTNVWYLGNKFNVKQEVRKCKDPKDILPCLG